MAKKLKAGLAVGTGLAALALMGPVAPANAGGGCANANGNTESMSKGDTARAFECLFNNVRDNSVDLNRDLGRAAQRHTDVMRQQQCFKHKCPGEDGLLRRVRDTGYLNGADNPHLGELIAYGNDKSPNDFVDKWLDSSEHRRLINDESFRDVGVGINTQDGDALVTVVFGHR